MKKEVELSDIVIIGAIFTTILAILKTFGILGSWWIVPIPFAAAIIVMIVCIVIALIDEFRY